MALSAALSAASIANAVAGLGASETKPSSGMQGYEVWNRSGLTVYVIDNTGTIIDAIQPYSQRSGTIILATRDLTFQVTKTDPIIPTIGYPSSSWQVLYQLVNVPLPQLSTMLNTGSVANGNPMQALANGTALHNAITTVNVPITIDMTCLWIYLDWSEANRLVNGIRVSGHQSGIFMRGLPGISPSGPGPLVGLNVVSLLTAYDTSVDVELNLGGTVDVPYWIVARRDSFDVNVEDFGNALINVQAPGGLGTFQTRQNIYTTTLQNAATADGNGTLASNLGINGLQMIEVNKTGAGTSSLVFEGINSTIFYPIGYARLDNNTTPLRSLSVLSLPGGAFNGIFQLLDNYQSARARMAGTAGAVSVTASLYGYPA